MADKRITDPSIPDASVAALDDIFLMVDVDDPTDHSTGTDNRITRENWVYNSVGPTFGASSGQVADGDTLQQCLAKIKNSYRTNTQLDATYEQLSNKGASSGYAPLDSNAKVPTANLPDAVLGAIQYQGVWDAGANSPALADGVGTQGHYYVVNVAGATSLDGITDWEVGDWAIFDGTAWSKIDNTDKVASVAGKTGVVTLDAADIISGTFADGRVSASSVLQHVVGAELVAPTAGTAILKLKMHATQSADPFSVVTDGDVEVFAIEANGDVNLHNPGTRYIAGVSASYPTRKLAIDTNGNISGSGYTPSISANINGLISGVDYIIGANLGNNSQVGIIGGASRISGYGGELLTYGYGHVTYPSAFRLQGAPGVVADFAAGDCLVKGVTANASATTNIVGGHLYLEGGNGASGSAGAAHGGNIYLNPGLGYGTGLNGQVVVNGATSLATLTLHGHSASDESLVIRTASGALDTQTAFLIEKNDATDVMSVLNDGSMGVGTNANSSYQFYVRRDDATSSILGRFENGNVTQANTLRIEVGNVNGLGTKGVVLNTDSGSGKFGIDVSDGGSPQFVIDPATDRVGINTTSPIHLLHVSTATAGQGAQVGAAFVGVWNGSTSYGAFCHENFAGVTNNYAVLQGSSGGTFVNAVSGDTGLRFAIDGTTEMILTDAGRFGVNNTSPTARFHVKQTDDSSVWVGRFEADGTTQNALNVMSDTTSGAGVRFDLGGVTGAFTCLNNGGVIVNGLSSLATLTVYGNSASDESLIAAAHASATGSQRVLGIRDASAAFILSAYESGDMSLGADFTPASNSIMTREKDFVVDYTSATARRFFGLRRNNSASFYLGVANANDDLIAGAAAGDIVMRSVNTDILFSADNGSTDHVRINSDDSIALNGSILTLNAGRNESVKTVNAATYDLLETDYILDVTYTSTGAVTSLTLPTAQTVRGRVIVIKDAGLNSSVNNITIDTEGSQLIEGSSTYVINIDGAAIRLYCNGTNWYII